MTLKKKTGHRPTHGFTLIELLVVIAIISILATILLPSLSKARELAKRASCVSNVRSIGLMVAMYGHENSDKLPIHGFEVSRYLYTFNHYAFNGYWWERGSFFDLVRYGYADDPNVFFCPSSDGHGSLKDSWPSPASGAWPNDRYWGNYSYIGSSPAYELYGWDFAGHTSGNAHSLASNADTVVAADFYQMGHPNEYSFNHDGEGGNTLFNDGHAEWFDFEDQASGYLSGPNGGTRRHRF